MIAKPAPRRRKTPHWLLLCGLCAPLLAACGIVSGLDHLENTDCVGPCGEDSAPPSETGADDAGRDADAHEDVGSHEDASSADASQDTKQGDAPSTDAAHTDASSKDANGADVTAADAHADTGSSCENDLSNVALGDFRISFSVNTAQTGLVAVLNQRIVCGTQNFWDIRILNGHIYAEVDDGTNFTTLTSTATVNNGQAHDVVVQRTALTLAITIDGQASGSMKAKASLNALPPLLTGTDPCQSPNPGSDETVAFSGTLKNVCVVRL